MKPIHSVLLLAAFVLLALCAGSQALAYVLMNPPNAWGPPEMAVPWRLNTTLDEPSVGGTHEFDIVRNSFLRWMAVAGTTSSVVEGASTTACGLAQNAINHISFRDCNNQCTSGCLAVTSTINYAPADNYWNPNTDTLLVARSESDITYSRSWNFGDYHDWPPCSNEFDLYGITIHEMGHFFGLGHSTLPASTMYFQIAPCDSTRASLHNDDTQGYRVLYGTTASPLALTTLQAGSASLTVTNKGNVAFTGSGGRWGTSFQYPVGSPQHIFECSFALAQVGGPVSDNFRRQALDGGDADFQQASPLTTAVPGPITDQEAAGTFTDVRAESPYGVTVVSRFFADGDAPNDAFVIAEYQIINTSGSPLNTMRAGLFSDVDFNDDYANNSVGYEADISLAWVSTPNTANRIGFAVLNVEGAAAMRALYATSNDPLETYTDANKQAWMSGGFDRTTLGPQDIALMIASGPFNIEVADTARVAFAFVGGTSLAQLRIHAQAARVFYLTNILNSTSVQDGRIINPVVDLAPNQPNPFGRSTRLEYTLYQAGPVRLDVIDASGRLVRTLVAQDQPKGTHAVQWDGTGEDGNSLASGVYFSRLHSAGGIQTQKLLMIR